mgnify:CR=1 FL=1
MRYRRLTRSWLGMAAALALLAVPGIATASTSGDGDHAAPVAQAKATVRITSVTSPVRPGDTATLRAAVPAGASCSIRYVTGKGTVSKAQGLGTKKADPSGNVSWSWKIGTGTASGTGTVTVTCGGTSATAKIVVQ